MGTKRIKLSTPNVKYVDTNVQLNGNNLNVVDSIIFLDVTVDKNLQFKLTRTLISASYALTKMKQITNTDIVGIVYFSYLHSIKSYGFLLWIPLQ